MNALMLYDRGSVDYEGINLSNHVQRAVENAGGFVKGILLNSDEIKPCLGCFNCWIKTPGLCVITNDCANDISREEIRADAMVLLTNLTYGGYSCDTKAFLDRSIPNILPLFETYRGEVHHKMRYERFPNLITIGYGESTDAERKTFRKLVERNVLNLRSAKYLTLTIENNSELKTVMLELERFFKEEVHT